jgi:uncharacterized coiled-coil protein SlyX
MKSTCVRYTGSTLLAIGALCALAAPNFADKKRDAKMQKVSDAMPIKQVVLFSSGVGYFAREGEVNGAREVELSFRAEQINDVLKSLVLFDAGGDVRPITYTIPDALAQSTRGFNVDEAASLGVLLRRFQGAQVTVETKKEKFAGRVLSVSVKTISLSGERETEIEVLNLLTEKGLRAVALDNVVRVQLLDEKLDGRLRENLSLAAQNFDNTRRTVTLNFGDGSTPGLRAVRAGYLLETPVWKTTYRLVLGDAKTQEKPYLQGWAIAENTTDDDWKNVNLSLVAGRPISFIQDLYAPLYVPRPVVAPQVIGSPNPQLYGAALEAAKDDAADEMEVQSPAPPPASFGGGGGLKGDKRLTITPSILHRSGVVVDGKPIVSAKQMQNSVSSQATAQTRGELFEYAIAQPVSIPHGQAALVPIVSETLNGEKISIFDARSSADYALSGFRLKNSTGLHLQGGPITVFDGGIYAGDAQISDMAPDEERLISYAVDPDLVIGREGQNNFQTIVSANVRAGVLQLQKKYRIETNYTFRNKSKTEKTVWVQQPRNSSFDLVAPEKADETTQSEYRFTVKVPAGQTVKFPVAVERVAGEAVALTDMNLDLLISYTRNAQLSDPVRNALEQIVEKRRAIVATQERIARLEKELQEFQQEQSRIRDNLRSVKDGTELHTRYLQKLAEQETQIETLQKQLADARDDLAEQQKALRAFVDTLTIDTK